MKKRSVVFIVFSAGLPLLLLLNSFSCRPYRNPNANELTGAWKGKVTFKTGPFAQVKDLEFMRVFNAGETMTESSNYDSAPPVPPAYGIWRKTNENKFEARYEFYTTNLPASFEDMVKVGGFTPSGYGVINEKINLSDDGKSFTSVISLTLFDKSGKQTASDEADAEGVKMSLD